MVKKLSKLINNHILSIFITIITIFVVHLLMISNYFPKNSLNNVYNLALIYIFVLTILIGISTFHNKNYYGVFIFAFVFLYLLYWLPYGFDITDEGCLITKGRFLFSNNWFNCINPIWGCLVINGLWLKIMPITLVLWNKIGFAILISFISFFSYKILNLFFNSIFIVFSIISTVFISTIKFPFSINYSNLPVFLFTVSIYLILSANSKFVKTKCFLSGFFLAISIFSRLTNIIFIPILLIWFIYKIIIGKKNFYYLISIFCGLFWGVLSGISILFFTKSIKLYYDVSFGKYIIDFFKNNNEKLIKSGHGLNNLINLFYNQIKSIFLAIIIFSFLIYLINLFFKKTKIPKVVYSIMLITIIYFTIDYLGFYWGFLGIYGSLLFFVLIEIINKKIYIYNDLIFFGILIMLVPCVASNNGLINSVGYGGIILIFPAILLICKKLKFIDYIPIIVSLIIITTYSGFSLQTRYYYRDSNKKHLNHPFKSKSLLGVYSSKLRVNAIDSLISKINTISDFNNSNLLILNNSPGLYALLSKPYLLSRPWDGLIPLNKLKNELDLVQDKIDYLILTNVNTRNRNWPKKISKCNKKDNEYYNFYLNFIRTKKFKLIYSNSAFSLYKKSIKI